jgi:hypothetical protein
MARATNQFHGTAPARATSPITGTNTGTGPSTGLASDFAAEPTAGVAAAAGDEGPPETLTPCTSPSFLLDTDE